MNISIQNVIDALLTPAVPMESTVDKLEFGDPAAIVKGIATTFLATQQVVEKAKSLGANLIISHEGIFFSHRGSQLLQANPVYIDKYRAFENSGIAVYRYHDHVHRVIPDGIMVGLLQALDWERFEVKALQTYSVVVIPEMTLQDVIIHIKNRLGMKYLRFIGDPGKPCTRIGLFAGYRGRGDLAVTAAEEEELDLVIYGEGPEWETPEYMRDAVYQGKNKSLIVLGHAESEAPGMEYLARLLGTKFPEVPVHYIPEEPVFKIG